MSSSSSYHSLRLRFVRRFADLSRKPTAPLLHTAHLLKLKAHFRPHQVKLSFSNMIISTV